MRKGMRQARTDCSRYFDITEEEQKQFPKASHVECVDGSLWAVSINEEGQKVAFDYLDIACPYCGRK